MRSSGLRSLGCAVFALWIGCASNIALGETASVIDPTEELEPPKPAVAAPKASVKPDAALKRARAEAEQRRRAKAEARAYAAKRQAAERESARLRAIENARQAESAEREVEARAAAKRAAAAQLATARASAAKAAAAREAATREAAAREAAARELAQREAAAREAAAKEAEAREAAAKEVAAREAAAKEAAAKEVAAKEMTARVNAAREARARENRVTLVAARPASARERPVLKGAAHTGTAFRDCAGCPELVWLPQGDFIMGDASAANGTRPVVAIHYELAVGRFEVTFAQWDACFAAGGCRRRPQDSGWGRDMQPVINVSWTDAQQYVAWLSRSTGKRYRLLTETEWEYAARAGTDVRFWWGDQAGRGDANCADCGSKWDGRQAAPVGRFAPNPFGLYDMHGNVAEWVEDCFHDRSYDRTRDAPLDGRAWVGDCPATFDTRVVRGGAWHGSANSVRSSSRSSAASVHFDNGIGFRVARTE